MALPPGIGGDLPDGDRKRLMQRADTFAIGTGTRELKDRDDAKAFDETLETVGQTRRVKSADEDVEKQAKETEEYRRDQLLEQAEKRGSSSPPSNLYPGCLTLPGLATPPPLLVGETGQGRSNKKSAAATSSQPAAPAQFSQPLLAALREAGLPDPVESLDDPRLGKAAERLSESYTMSLKGYDRVYVWNRGQAHQILTIGLHETKVESAAGDLVETLRRVGQSDEKTVAVRPLPENGFPSPE